MVNVDDGAGESDDGPWPRFTADVERARIRAVEQHELEPLGDIADEQPSFDRDLRWFKVRILALEAALTDSRAEAASLNDYLELCFQLIENQDERLSDQQRILQVTVDELLGRFSRHEQTMLELHSSQNEAAERSDNASAELLEVERRAQEAAERLEAVLRDADEEVRVLADKAADRADFSIDSVSALQVDLEKEANTLRQRLDAVATNKDLQEVEREIERVRSEIDTESGDEIVVAPKKRFRYYLPEQVAPSTQKALPAGSEDAGSSDDSSDV